MLVDLVRAQAADGLRLDGALLSSATGIRPRTALDGLLCLHGVTSNFYSSTIQETLAASLLPLGMTVVWANTRGHDGHYTGSVGGRRRRLGSAYELVDECRHDIAGWIDFLAQRGCRRVGLLGHSLGAIKALYSQAHQAQAAVHAVIAVSPARLSHSAFTQGPDSGPYVEALATAAARVQAGRPEELIEVNFPFPMLITAAGYLDKYGPAERYDILRFAPQIACPALFVFGERELATGGVAFAGLPQALQTLPSVGQQFEFVTIPDADHVYTGTAEVLSRTVATWIEERFALG